MLSKKNKYSSWNHIYATYQLIAHLFSREGLGKFLSQNGIRDVRLNSAQLSFHFALLTVKNQTLFIVEDRKNQSKYYVYKKLQTCDFKRKQYLKLVTPLGLKVEYVYVLNDWFKKPEYRDVLDDIQSMNCHYKFNELPLSWLGLPVPKP